MTNQIIEVPDIAVVKTEAGVKKVFSLRDQKVKKESLHDFNTGCGVMYQGDLYVLDSEGTPVVTMTAGKEELSTVEETGSLNKS